MYQETQLNNTGKYTTQRNSRNPKNEVAVALIYSANPGHHTRHLCMRCGSRVTVLTVVDISGIKYRPTHKLTASHISYQSKGFCKRV